MHKTKVTVNGKEIEVDTFDTVVHVNKGMKHALKDIERLMKESGEDERLKGGNK